MPLTDAESNFLDAYVYEVYTAAMSGPHSLSLRRLGAAQWDLAWLLKAWHGKALAEGKNPMGSCHSECLPLPWSSKDEILTRGQELREELEHREEPCRPAFG